MVRIVLKNSPAQNCIFDLDDGDAFFLRLLVCVAREAVIASLYRSSNVCK